MRTGGSILSAEIHSRQSTGSAASRKKSPESCPRRRSDCVELPIRNQSILSKETDMYTVTRTLVAAFACTAALMVAHSPAIAQEKTPEAKQGKYRVYTWHCSRSIQMTLATDNLGEVRVAVDKAIKDGAKYRVTTGTESNALSVLRTPDTLEVFATSCRIGWRSRGIVATQAEADDLIKQQAAFGGVVAVGIYDAR
jgi:hypothetical protein